jgi:hypothetical protein
MSKGHQNSHNETAATAWHQCNANWWSEIKTTKSHNSPLKNKAMEEIDNKAAGQLSSMELFCITAAALEGYQMR